MAKKTDIHADDVLDDLADAAATAALFKTSWQQIPPRKRAMFMLALEIGQSIGDLLSALNGVMDGVLGGKTAPIAFKVNLDEKRIMQLCKAVVEGRDPGPRKLPARRARRAPAKKPSK